jgi:hypothetical protein
VAQTLYYSPRLTPRTSNSLRLELSQRLLKDTI